MKSKRSEAEVIVRLDQQGGYAHVCVAAWPAMMRKMTKLYGPSMDVGRGGQSERWLIPLKSVRFRSLSSLTKATGRPFPRSKPRAAAQFESVTHET
jgi:hypothetical protein